MSHPKLKLATKLEDLETQHRPASRSPFHQLRQERYQDQETDRLPRSHFHVGQLLYTGDMQKGYPAWKRWVQNHVHIPLFRWFEEKFGLFPPTGKRIIDGAYVWNSHQGCFVTRAEADRDAARYPHGYVVPNMPLGQSLTESAPEKSSIYFSKGSKEERSPISLSTVLSEMGELHRDLRIAAARTTLLK